MSETAERSEPPDQPVPPPAGTGSGSGRCHWCGYSLKGLADRGNCPECGRSFTPDSANQLQPWPSALMICLRLGWPIAGLMLTATFLASSWGNDLRMLGTIIGYTMIVSVTINSYFQIRSMLRRSLPEQIRTQGPVAIWRKIGTTVCVIILLVFVGGPFVFGVGCLVLLSSMGRF
ncbi:MAG: hypothetical protein IIA64_01665 [Planctomycetes bacterium]|nr:hypothetical protein [Planctomycetota bacterium]